MTAFQNWSFGISNRYPMIAIIFVCSCFLLMQALTYFISHCIYEDYDAPKDADRDTNREILDASSYMY